LRDNSAKTEKLNIFISISALSKVLFNKCIKHLYKEFEEKNVNSWVVLKTLLYVLSFIFKINGRHGRDCMVVGLPTNYLCTQCLSPLTLWLWYPLRRDVLDTTLCIICQVGGFLRVLRF